MSDFVRVRRNGEILSVDAEKDVDSYQLKGWKITLEGLRGTVEITLDKREIDGLLSLAKKVTP